MYKKYYLSVVVLCLVIFSHVNAQEKPTFKKGQDLKPLDKEWILNQEVSDEFNGNSLDKSKWKTWAKGWIGRPPGLFKDNTISVSDGCLKITNYKLKDSVVIKGKKFTHACGLVAAVKGTQYGYYECRMKASKTFMSSTFWLMSQNDKKDGCDKRTTELDIQECVGQVTGTKKWCKSTDKRMGSNTHSRSVPKGCSEKEGIIGSDQLLPSGKVYEDYHVYGAWWKNANEVLFYLDGEFVNKVTPAADFDMEMYLRMVTETYGWNPTPKDGGMNLSETDRTTFYDWVRYWTLE